MYMSVFQFLYSVYGIESTGINNMTSFLIIELTLLSKSLTC